MNAVNHAIGTQRQLIATVTHAARCFLEQFDFVELVIAISIAEAVQAPGIIRIRIKRIVGKEQAAALEQVGVDRLDSARCI